MGYRVDSVYPGIRTEFLNELGPPSSGTSLGRSSQWEEASLAASDWKNRAVGFFPQRSNLGDLVERERC